MPKNTHVLYVRFEIWKIWEGSGLYPSSIIRDISGVEEWKAPHRSLIPREVLEKFIRTLWCMLCQLASTSVDVFVPFLLAWFTSYYYYWYSQRTKMFNLPRKQTITSLHFTRIYFMFILYLFILRLLTLFDDWCGYVIKLSLNLLECSNFKFTRKIFGRSVIPK